MRMPRRPKKRCAKRGQNASTDPLVNPGDTAHCEPHGPASDPGNSNHRLVNLEKNPSSCGQDRAYAPKNATVMLRQRRGQFQHIRLRPLGAGAHVAEKTLQDQLHNAASARQSGKAASIVARSPSSSVRQAAVASASASAAVGAEMDMLASVDAEGAPVPGSRM